MAVSSLRTVGRNSLVYMTLEVVTNGISFFLLPVYTRILTPRDYGILAVVASLTSFLSVGYGLGLPAASNRFYFERPDDRQYLGTLWGTLVTFMIASSFCLTALFLVVGRWSIGSLLGDVPFYPYLALGLITISTVPVFELYQASLRARQQAVRYSVQNFVKVLSTTALTVMFVVLLGMGAAGPLLAMATVSVLAFAFTIVVFGRELRFGIDRPLLGTCLGYSVPHMPHGLAGWMMSLMDRLFVNRLRSAADAGLYSIGSMLGAVMSLCTAGFNEAFNPYFMQAMKDERNRDLHRKVQGMAAMVVGGYTVVAICLSLFAREVLMLMTTEHFYAAWIVSPFAVFAAVLQGVYRFAVGPLFYNLKGGKFVSLGTFTAGISNVLLLLWFIPRYGILGAGLAGLLANLIALVFIAFVAYRVQPFGWDYGKFAATVGIGMLGCFGILALERRELIFDHVLFKLAGAGLLVCVTLVVASGGIGRARENAASIMRLAVARLR